MFKLKITKEIYPYDYYTQERYINGIGNIDEAMKCIKGKTKGEFIEALIAAGAKLSDTEFNMHKYA